MKKVAATSGQSVSPDLRGERSEGKRNNFDGALLGRKVDEEYRLLISFSSAEFSRDKMCKNSGQVRSFRKREVAARGPGSSIYGGAS
jgi:hypothetical protein